VHIGSITGAAPTTVALTADATNLVNTSASLTPTLGRVYSATINGQSFSYQVTAADMAAATPADQVASNLAAGLSSSGILNGTTVVATAATDTLVLTGTAGYSASLGTTTGGTSLIAGSVGSQATAQAAITEVSTAIQTIADQRSTLGAHINRLTYTADNLSNISQNAAASRSRVQDTDYAKTSTELARTQIIAQASTAMLAQANQSQQSVLALLK
jgi:flagellin